MTKSIHVEVYEATVKGDHRTCFTKVFAKHDKLRFMGYEKQYKILKILSDAELVIEVAGDDQLGEIETIIGKHKFGAKSPMKKKVEEEMIKSNPLGYEVLKHIDQSQVFSYVFDRLASGRPLGIFPEGGSHDRTDILPIKVGIAIIAFGMLERHNITVPIIPVGLTYFRGHRFRGRCVVEFGAPLRIPDELIEQSKVNKR